MDETPTIETVEAEVVTDEKPQDLVTVKTKSQLYAEKRRERFLKLREELKPYETIKVRAERIVEHCIKLHENIHSNDPRVRSAMRRYMKKRPGEFRSRFASSTFWLNKLLPTKIQHQGDPDLASRRPMRADDLERAGLTVEQLRKLAGFDENGTEAEVRAPESATGESR